VENRDGKTDCFVTNPREREGERTKRLAILTTWLCRQQMNAWQNIEMTVGSQKMSKDAHSYHMILRRI
jgi:hypothetical protein